MHRLDKLVASPTTLTTARDLTVTEVPALDYNRTPDSLVPKPTLTTEKNRPGTTVTFNKYCFILTFFPVLPLSSYSSHQPLVTFFSLDLAEALGGPN